MSQPFVSVIIPVYNDSRRLVVCLEALENQTYPRNLYEVIVVDNGSLEKNSDIFTKFSKIIFSKEDFPTAAAARNKGILLAKGQVIAFTDSDCMPASNWIERGVNYLAQVDNCGLVAGKVEVFFKNYLKPTMVELYEYIYAFPQEKLIDKCHFSMTANLFIYKEVINKVGLFDRDISAGEDRELTKRIFGRNYKQVYAVDVCVAHSARCNIKQLVRKKISMGKGLYELYCKQKYSLAEFIYDFIYDWPLPRDFLLISLPKHNKNSLLPVKVILISMLAKIIQNYEFIRLLCGGIKRERVVNW